MSYLIVGLGNIGNEYEGTRHNIGFEIVDALAKRWKGNFELNKLAYECKTRYRGKPCYLIKPTTYMNLSGKAVLYYSSLYKIPHDRILVIVDDLALPFGAVRLRGKGSSAGHNGLKSIEALLASSQYPRLRIGIGDNYPKGRQADYVLGRFSREEEKKIPDLLMVACEAVESFIFRGLGQTMTAFNGK